MVKLFGVDSMFRDEIDALPVKYPGDIRLNTLVLNCYFKYCV